MIVIKCLAQSLAYNSSTNGGNGYNLSVSMRCNENIHKHSQNYKHRRQYAQWLKEKTLQSGCWNPKLAPPFISCLIFCKSLNLSRTPFLQIFLKYRMLWCLHQRICSEE